MSINNYCFMYNFLYFKQESAVISVDVHVNVSQMVKFDSITPSVGRRVANRGCS
ncbi:hypothetical protein QKQ66_gp125 [Dione juno nucleopolyhedrovirus]|uniref:Uncharacterized protein n=1 Tax=Dione juno nucleopolyhedrovirus TaxID=2594175 RepID=A0AAE6H2U7_9ABAC|nr:hypothetical protein QKQ66_gp125 [Dione juno nucleopolyhedrovirus]QDL56994.1 hypothetical protein DijuNPV-ORF-125 [Dione juno nucleopolyhedrovirus]